MTVADILLLAKGAGELMNLLYGIANDAQSAGRDPTPEEVQRVKDAQHVADTNWAALLPK